MTIFATALDKSCRFAYTHKQYIKGDERDMEFLSRLQRAGVWCEPAAAGISESPLSRRLKTKVSLPAKTALKVEDLLESAMSGAFYNAQFGW
jgi:ribosomal protein S4